MSVPTPVLKFLPGATSAEMVDLESLGYVLSKNCSSERIQSFYDRMKLDFKSSWPEVFYRFWGRFGTFI